MFSPSSVWSPTPKHRVRHVRISVQLSSAQSMADTHNVEEDPAVTLSTDTSLRCLDECHTQAGIIVGGNDQHGTHLIPLSDVPGEMALAPFVAELYRRDEDVTMVILVAAEVVRTTGLGAKDRWIGRLRTAPESTKGCFCKSDALYVLRERVGEGIFQDLVARVLRWGTKLQHFVSRRQYYYVPPLVFLHRIVRADKGNLSFVVGFQ